VSRSVERQTIGYAWRGRRGTQFLPLAAALFVAAVLVRADARVPPAQHAATAQQRATMPRDALDGYRHRLRVVVHGGSQAVSGDTTPTNTGTDYVVLLHLTGAQATAVFHGATYGSGPPDNATPFGDVTMWYTGGHTPRQIDVDADTATYGPWSARNVTLWFKLQAPLRAKPAADSHYVLAWGNHTPRVARDWVRIYPLQAHVATGGIDPATWNALGNVSVGGGILTVADTGNGQRNDMGIQSDRAFGVGYAVSARTQLPPVASGQYITVGWQDGLAPNGQRYSATGAYFVAASAGDHSPTTWVADYYNGSTNSFTKIGPLDDAYRVYTVARDGRGNPYYWRDAEAAVPIPNTASTSELNAVFHITNFTAAPFSAHLAWIKVRPWIAVEPYAGAVGRQ